MILCSASLAVVFLIIFIVNVRKGQFEDDESPAVRILFEDPPVQENPKGEDSQSGIEKEEEKEEKKR